MKNYFLFAGEASGDLHGSRLIQALQAKNDSACFYGVGGPRMRQAGLECLLPMENFQVMGFSDVIKALPSLWKLFYQTRDLILEKQPDCVILIDYPGFNLRLGRALRQKGYKGKLVQYICPTVWAHGKKRIDILVNYFDLLLTIFPFEKHYFANRSLQVEYIGNPLVENIQSHAYQTDWKILSKIPEHQPLIALFPGSRQGEIQRHIPQQLRVAAQLKEKHPELCFALSCAQESLKDTVHNLVQKGPLKLNQGIYIVPSAYHYELMKNCHTALAKSGTVTLELALHQVPTVVHYELSPLNHFFAKYILRLKLPFYCMVNILSQKEIFPEIIGKKLNEQQIINQLEKLHFNLTYHQQVQQECEKLQQQLGCYSSHQRAADVIQDL